MTQTNQNEAAPTVEEALRYRETLRQMQVIHEEACAAVYAAESIREQCLITSKALGRIAKLGTYALTGIGPSDMRPPRGGGEDV